MQINTETRVGLFVLIALGIFFYMTLFLGFFRLDRNQYNAYSIYFDDISGLEKKATVKIAGVPVGWVDRVELVQDDPYQAKAYIMVRKEYTLHENAYGIVRQEGLLGSKYLEIVSGDPLLAELPPGSPLGKPGRAPTSVDEILHKVYEIATNIEDVTDSLHESLGGMRGRDTVQEIVDHFSKTTGSIAAFTEKLDHLLTYNEGNISSIMDDLKDLTHDLKESIPDWGRDIQRLSNKLEFEFIPELQSNVNKIATVFDRDLSGLAQQAEQSFKNINSIAAKVDSGKGLFGKLVNDDALYDDLKESAQGLKLYFSKMNKLSIVIDAHGEYMYRPAELMPFEDAKGYLDVRIHPNEDHFYIVQVVGSQKGNLKRRSLLKNWYDEEGKQFLPRDFFARGQFLPELIGRIDTIQRKLDSYKYGFQVGKIFKDICFRFGLFENSVGIGIDIDIPFNTDKLRWVTSLEAFDFRGRDRINDSRPHFKWINRVFILRNIYAAFGADDFVSKRNANAFFGFGLRFCDDDLKYLASQIGILGIS